MKKLIILSVAIFLSISSFAQPAPLQLTTGDPTCLTGYTSLSNKIKPIFKKAYCAATCEVVNPWTGECDVVSTEPMPSDKLKASKIAKIEALNALEDALHNGMGKSILPKSFLEAASKVHSGKKLSALKKRFIYIITKMESETEDE